MATPTPLTAAATTSNNSTDAALAAATSAADARYIADWLARLTALLNDNAFDRDAWHRLARDGLAARQPIARMRPFWDRLTQQFPYHPAFWETWIGEELKAQNTDYALQLLNKTFTKDFVLSPMLGIFYATAHATAPNAAFDPVQREKIIKAYEVALDKTGLDYNAAPLYDSYITFLHKCHAPGPYAERQKLDSIRRVYVRAIRVPFAGVDKLWNDYCQFEATHQQQPSTNPQAAAAGGLNEHARDYTAARTALKRLDVLIKHVRRDLLPMPVRNTPAERDQVNAWRAWIDWERANALQTDDAVLVQRRTLYAAACAAMCITHFLEPWLQNVALRERFADTAATVTANASDGISGAEHARRLLDEAVGMCSRGAEILSGIPLLHLMHAELEERRASLATSSAEKTVAIYERALTSVKFGATLVYIHYMLCMRRMHRGGGITAARDVFKQGRADARCTIELYLAAALMEYFHAANNTSTPDEQQQPQRLVAQKILDLGVAKHQQQQQQKGLSGGDSAANSIPFDYQRWYVLFQMLVTNDASRARLAIERCVSSSSLKPESENSTSTNKISVEQKLQMSSLALLYEQLQGDFDTIQQTQHKRLALLLPSSSNGANNNKTLALVVGGTETNIEPSLIVSKWKLFDLMPARTDDLDVMSYCELRDEQALHAPLEYGAFCRAAARGNTFAAVHSAMPHVAAAPHVAAPAAAAATLPAPKPMVVPDDGYLIPFKPRQYVRPPAPRHDEGDYLSLPGGEFALVGSLEYLRRQLPRTFQGPFVSISRLAEVVLSSNDRLPPLQPVEYLDTGIDWLARAARDDIREEREKLRKTNAATSSRRNRQQEHQDSLAATAGGVKRVNIIRTEDDDVKDRLNGTVVQHGDGTRQPKREAEDLALPDGGGQRDLYSERAKKMLKNTLT